ncbi:hypothetical protein EJB05_11731, partial [Eragrostis curvula]
MLGEKLCWRTEDDPKHWGSVRGSATTITYLGDSRFCLVEDILCGENARDGAVIHVTVFGLMYDQKGELQTKGYNLRAQSAEYIRELLPSKLPLMSYGAHAEQYTLSVSNIAGPPDHRCALRLSKHTINSTSSVDM